MSNDKSQILPKTERKWRRDMLKQVEGILHPNPMFNGVEIAHRHLTTGDIEFTAWNGDNEASNGRRVRFDKEYILSASESFYAGEPECWRYLTTGDIKEPNPCN